MSENPKYCFKSEIERDYFRHWTVSSYSANPLSQQMYKSHLCDFLFYICKKSFLMIKLTGNLLVLYTLIYWTVDLIRVNVRRRLRKTLRFMGKCLVHRWLFLLKISCWFFIYNVICIYTCKRTFLKVILIHRRWVVFFLQNNYHSWIALLMTLHHIFSTTT